MPDDASTQNHPQSHPEHRRGRPAAAGTNPAVGVRIEPELLRKLDRWRAAQPDLPGRPEAIRRLLELALADNDR